MARAGPVARSTDKITHVAIVAGWAAAIDGLYLAGQTTCPGFGVATSMFSGIFAADAALRR